MGGRFSEMDLAEKKHRAGTSNTADGSSASGLSTAELLKQLATLSPQSDRDTLFRTIDTVVSTVQSRLKAGTPGSALPADLVQLTRTTLAILEACSGMRDPEIAAKGKIWAAQLQEAFARALAPPQRPASPPPNLEPASSKAKKTVEAAPAKPKPAEKTAPPPTADPKAAFDAAFTEHFCRYIRRKVEAFEIIGVANERLPFVVAPAFSLIFEQIIKNHIVPRMLANRRIKNLSTSMNMNQLDGPAFNKEFQQYERDNIVLAIWNDVWNEIHQALTTENENDKAKKQKKAQKASLLDRLARWRTKEEQARSFTHNIDQAKDLWKAFEVGGIDGNFDPPKVVDIPIFREAFQFDLDAIETAKESVKQLIRQESKGEAREGVTRDHLNQLLKALPSYCGEMIALWGYYQHRDLFSAKMMRSFQASHGKNPQERRKYLPLFMRWIPDYTRAKQEI